MHSKHKFIFTLLAFLLSLPLFTAVSHTECMAKTVPAQKITVLPGLWHEEAVSPENLKKFKDIDILVIDASEFTTYEIFLIHQTGCKVYSYLNIGSLEQNRAYYDDYSHLCFKDYENWPDEKWIDVTSPDWQKKCINIGRTYVDNGVDGFFIDNVDVYEEMLSLKNKKGKNLYSAKAVKAGIDTILKGLSKENLAPLSISDSDHPDIILNCGFEYIKAKLKDNKKIYFNGVCQECVYTTVHSYDPPVFSKSTDENKKYYSKILTSYHKKGLSVWLIEYSNDALLTEQIKNTANKKGWSAFISTSLALSHP